MKRKIMKKFSYNNNRIYRGSIKIYISSEIRGGIFPSKDGTLFVVRKTKHNNTKIIQKTLWQGIKHAKSYIYQGYLKEIDENNKKTKDIQNEIDIDKYIIRLEKPIEEIETVDEEIKYYPNKNIKFYESIKIYEKDSEIELGYITKNVEFKSNYIEDENKKIYKFSEIISLYPQNNSEFIKNSFFTIKKDLKNIINNKNNLTRGKFKKIIIKKFGHYFICLDTNTNNIGIYEYNHNKPPKESTICLSNNLFREDENEIYEDIIKNIQNNKELSAHEIMERFAEIGDKKTFEKLIKQEKIEIKTILNKILYPQKN